MSSRKTKRPRSKSISPPPLRRKLITEPTTTTASRLAPASSSSLIPPEPVINPDHIRIYSWNINGTTPLLQRPITQFFSTPSQNSPAANKTQATPLRTFLARHAYPQFLCLQEVKISPTDTKTPLLLEAAANYRSESPRYKAFFSLPKNRPGARGYGAKVYGVCTLIREDLIEREDVETQEAKWDIEGRVLISLLKKSKLVIINGYWVNGTSNAWKDFRTGEILGTRHDAKRIFQREMLAEAEKWVLQGWDVVSLGDINIARDIRDGWPGIRLGVEHVRNRKEFNDLFFGSDDVDAESGEGKSDWVDAWRELRGEERAYTYYGRSGIWGESCDRVDMALISRGLVNQARLLAADIFNTPEERGHSDHVPLSVTINLSRQDSEDG